MKIHFIDASELTIPPNRQRKVFSPEEISTLAGSISEIGLIHPLVVRKGDREEIILVAGERRLRALNQVWNFGEKVKFGEYIVEENMVPCIWMGEMDDIAAFEMELEENVRRVDLDWKEKASATSQLYELRRMQAERDDKPAPTVAELTQEIHGTAEGGHYDDTRKELIVSRHLDDPDVQKAKSTDEAFKLLKRKEETKKNAAHGFTIGKTFTSADHALMKGDCLDILIRYPDHSFDVILTDPPYGMNAQEFGDSGGKAAGAHFYDDTFENFERLMQSFSIQSFRLAKPLAHLYLFCDLDNFAFLRSAFGAAGWKVFRTPLIWFQPTAFRAPWPDQGPQRKYQTCLYAVKGNKPITKILGDVITASIDENLGHQAQKPVALYKDLLSRSVKPGDMVLDPFCGSGTIFPAAHALLCRATGIELDEAAYGLAAKRLGALDGSPR
jgi:site-specific DNA-methyltransferase (adenine-specific)